MKKYKTKSDDTSIAAEPATAYASLQDSFNTIADIDLDDKYTFLSIIRKGLDFTVLIDFLKIADLHIDEMAHLLHINSRTIRRMSHSDTLNADLSEKLIELIRLFKLGHEIFGDTHIFNEWMRRQVAGLGYARPLDLVDTSIGIEIVGDELYRLAYGVYS